MNIELQNHVKLETEAREDAFVYDRGKVHINQKSEIAEALEELNKDVIEDQTGRSSIDMRSNLHFTEISSLLALDVLARLNFLPPEINWLGRQKKRLSVSKGGLGRMQTVQLVTGNSDRKNTVNGLWGVVQQTNKEEDTAKGGK